MKNFTKIMLAFMCFIVMATTASAAFTWNEVPPIDYAAPYAYVIVDNHTISVIDITSNQIVTTIPLSGVGENFDDNVVITPDGKKVYVSSRGNSYDTNYVSVIDITTNTIIKTIHFNHDVAGVIISPDGSKVYTKSSYSSGLAISVIDTSTDTVVKTIEDNTGQYMDLCMIASPDGTKLYLGWTSVEWTGSSGRSQSGYVSVIDVSTGTVISETPVGMRHFKIVITPDGKKVYTTNYECYNISVFSTVNNEVSSIAMPYYNTCDLVVNSDGTRLYTSGVTPYPYKKLLIVIDTETDSVIKTIEIPYYGDVVAVTPDGTKICAISGNSSSGIFYTIDASTYAISDPVTVEKKPYDNIFFAIGPKLSAITVGQGASTSAIKQKFIEAYNRNGGLSVLGNPTTRVHLAFGLEVQDFPEMPATAGGVIMYNPNDNTAYFIHGAIWDKYYAYPDVDKAKLGHIASDEEVAAIQPGKTTGNYTKFETGTIHWISDVAGENINNRLRGQSFVTYGDIDKLYTEMGGTYSDLGFPLMDQVTKADGHDYCMFDGGIIVWEDSTYAYKAIITSKPITIETSFLPNPNGYKFENYVVEDEYSWKNFESIYGDQDRYVHDYNLFTPTFLPTKANIFYNCWFKDVRESGNCFGFSGSSLQLKKNSFIAYGPNNKEDKVSEAWSNVGPYAYEYSPATVQDWIEYYTAVQFSNATLDDISKYQETKGEETTYIGAKSVYDELKIRMSSNNWAENPMILCFYCNILNKTSGKIDKVSGHAVVPYKIVEDKNSVKIYVYDCNPPNDSERFIEFDKLTWKASNYDDWDKDGIKEQPFGFGMVSLEALNASPKIPDHVTANSVGFANLLFTDSSGKQLGYYQGEFKDEITGAHRIINYGSGTGSESLESYYVPDSSIKMELYGKNEGASDVTMLTPNGAITANIPVSANSLDEFKMLNDGKGVEFKSGSGTSSLNLTISVETPDSAQIVYADFLQIVAGGSIDLSNVDGIINIENTGQPITCSLYLAQFDTNTNSSDSIENISIEEGSTVIVKPSDWSDIANSEIVIEHDIGSDGSIDSTVVVNTPAEKIEDMKLTIQGIVASSELNKGQGNALTVKLNSAAENIELGNTEEAASELGAFINQVEAFVKTENISVEESQALTDEANDIINALKTK